jgi:hypothetical protein
MGLHLSRHRRALSVAILGALALDASLAMADEKVGGAAIVRNDVRGQTQAKLARIAQGDQVFQNELVRTGADSMTKIVLLDETNVSLGPQSQLTLDKFVFEVNAGARDVGISATKGAFRFFSGRSPHEAYQVQTPQATIGVRGTIYDVRVMPGLTRVVLQEGAVHVCVRDTERCVDLDQPGQAVEVKADAIEGPMPAAGGWNFGSLCGSSGAAFCARTQFASIAPANIRAPRPTRVTQAVPDPEPVRRRITRARPAPEPKPVRVARIHAPRHVANPPRRRVIRVEEPDEEVVYVRPPAIMTPYPAGIGFGGRFGGRGGGDFGGRPGGFGGRFGGGGQMGSFRGMR